MKKLIFLLFVLLYVAAFSQINPSGTSTFGGTLNDMANDIIQNSNGDYILAGCTYSYGAGGSDMWVIKVGQDGIRYPDWNFTFGGPDNEKANSIQQTTDDGYIIAGYTVSYAAAPNSNEMWVVKIHEDGAEEWATTYGEGSAKWVSLTSDGGYIIAGSNLIKTDGSGNEEWRYAGGFTSVVEVTTVGSEGYVALGDNMFNNLVLTKFDLSLNPIWTEEFQGGGLDFAEEVIQTEDGGFMISSTSSPYSGGYLNIWLIKTDDMGIEEWSEVYGGFYHDECHGIKQTIDGGYILTGIKQVDNQFNNDVWVIKIDAQGTIQWDWSEDLLENNWGHAVIQTLDYGYAIAGMTRNTSAIDEDMYLIQFAPDPLTAWFTGTPTSIESGQTVKFTDGTLGNPAGYTFEWTFESGTTAQPIIQNPTVTYGVEGTFDVTLKWFDGSTVISELTRSDYITVGTGPPPPPTYCTSSGDASNNWINSVSLNGQANPSGSSGTVGYEDYTSVIFNLDAGGAYDIVLEPGSVPSNKKVPKTWRVWIDFDLEGDFDAEEEVFAIDNKKGEVSGTISIPPGFSGETRMRVSMSTELIPPPPCGFIMSGEVEDYTIFVAPPTPQRPVADFTADQTSVLPNTIINFEDLSTNDPLIWAWTFENEDGTIILQSSLQDPSIVFTTEGTYTVTLEATNTLGSDTEVKMDYIIVSSTPPVNPYCEPDNIQNSWSANIKDFDIDGLNNLSYMNLTGYFYFYDFDTYELVKGGTHTVTLTPGDNRARNFWRLWIDFDGDGFFEDTELLIVANNKKGTVSDDIIIPTNDLTEGITRMRVSMQRGGAPLGPCDDDFEGEVEDYNVKFIDELKEAPTVSSTNKLSDITLYPNPVHGDQLTIEFANQGITANIQIFNKFGAVVDQFETYDNKITLNVAHYATGVYFVKVNNAGELHMVKFVKR